MRECPFCKAQIEDNARFCLYCMKPLVEKEIIPPQKKDMRWLFAVAALAMAIVVILLLPDRKPVKPQEPSAATPGSTVSITTQTEIPTADPMQESTGESVAEPTDDTISTESTVISATEMSAESTGAAETKPGGTKPAAKGTEGTRAPATTPIAPGTKGTVGAGVPITTKPVNSFVSIPTTKPTGNTGAKPNTVVTTEPATKPATKATDAPATASTTKPAAAPTTKPTTAPTSKPTTPPATEAVDVSKLPRYIWDHPQTMAILTYRPAVQADVLGLDYQVTSNDIVIIDVFDSSGNGWFAIPDYIDGKRVIAIGPSSFPAEDIPEMLYLPKTLLALHSGAFGEDGARWLYVPGEILALGDNTKIWEQLYTTRSCVNQYGENFSNFENWHEWSAQTYIYRTALPSDVGDVNYQNTNGDIVIIDIDCPIPNYVYDIPAYIDGKKVVALGQHMFDGRDADAVYVPATVKYIGARAFYGCQAIYFRGENIYAPSNPFTYGITPDLHCSATCRNGDIGYYKDLAKGYNVTWKEWNG